MLIHVKVIVNHHDDYRSHNGVYAMYRFHHSLNTCFIIHSLLHIHINNIWGSDNILWWNSGRITNSFSHLSLNVAKLLILLSSFESLCNSFFYITSWVAWKWKELKQVQACNAHAIHTHSIFFKWVVYDMQCDIRLTRIQMPNTPKTRALLSGALYARKCFFFSKDEAFVRHGIRCSSCKILQL
jgi:hypothetical protein